MLKENLDVGCIRRLALLTQEQTEYGNPLKSMIMHEYSMGLVTWASG